MPTRDAREFQFTFGDVYQLALRRRFVLLAFLLGTLAVVVASRVLAPAQFWVSSRIEVATVVFDDRPEPVEGTELMLANLNEVALPEATARFAVANPGIAAPATSITAIAKGRHLRFESKVSEGQIDAAKRFQRELVAVLASEHRRLVDIARVPLRGELERIGKRIETQRELSDKLLARLQQLDKATMTSPKATEAVALSSLLVGLRSSLQSTLYSDATGRIEALEQRQGRLKRILSLYSETKQVGEAAVVPASPVAWKKTLLLGSALGLFLGFAVSFLLEFGTPLRELLKPSLVEQRS